jgi:hypothetical protein
MSALGSFLESKSIKTGALLAASRRLEARTPADHELVLKRDEKKRTKKEGGEPIAKPRSGRGLSKKQLDAALAGKGLTKRARAKTLRALTALLEKAKQPAPTIKDVFGEEKALAGKAKGNAKDAKK